MYGTRWSTGIMLGLVTTACLAACNQSKSEPGDQEINAPEPAPAAVLDDGQRTAFAETRMDFAWDLYRNLHELEGNLFFSPYSVSTALAMTYAGARGETAAEMATALGFTLPDDALHAAFAEREQALALAQREGIELSTANRLWGDTSETFLDGFTSLVAERVRRWPRGDRFPRRRCRGRPHQRLGRDGNTRPHRHARPARRCPERVARPDQRHLLQGDLATAVRSGEDTHRAVLHRSRSNPPTST
jgi:hypothetical protein